VRAFKGNRNLRRALRKNQMRFTGTTSWNWTSILLCAVVLLSGAVLPGQETHAQREAARPAAESLADGRQFFETRCAGCHGIDGRGGERAPDIATDVKVQQHSDLQLTEIINNGIPAAGMPAFPVLDDATGKSLIAYLRLLQGKTGAAKLPGDPAQGKALFFDRGKCSDCHMVNGAGGFLGSDLSGYSRTRSLDEIRQAIVKPDNTRRSDVVTVVTTRDKQTYSGVIRNEDNFSLQLQTPDGAFHLFLKSDLASFSRQPSSLMPADYGSALSQKEMNDLISFLISVRGQPDPAAKNTFVEDEENE
jgi:cytochrome c oxidase cbb3-type subunit III